MHDRHAIENKQQIRAQSGSVLVESVSGITIIFLLLVAGVVLAATVGVFMLYKVKLGFIANQAAQFAAGKLSWNSSYYPTDPASPYISPNQGVTDLVNKMCAIEGLPTPATTTLTDTGTTVVCKIQVAGLVYPFALPIPVTMSDTGSASLTAYQPPAILEVHPQNPAASAYIMTIPCYGFATQANLRSNPTYKFIYTINGPVAYY